MPAAAVATQRAAAARAATFTPASPSSPAAFDAWFEAKRAERLEEVQRVTQQVHGNTGGRRSSFQATQLYREEEGYF